MFKINRKAQSEIITTVLIILLVLAAIIIVWQVVSSTINAGAEGIDETSQCIGIDVALLSAKAPAIDAATTGSGTKGNVTLRRDSNEPEGKSLEVIILVNGERTVESANLLQFQSQTVKIGDAASPTLDLNEDISLGYIIDGKACPNDPEVLGKVTA